MRTVGLEIKDKKVKNPSPQPKEKDKKVKKPSPHPKEKEEKE